MNISPHSGFLKTKAARGLSQSVKTGLTLLLWQFHGLLILFWGNFTTMSVHIL